MVPLPASKKLLEDFGANPRRHIRCSILGYRFVALTGDSARNSPGRRPHFPFPSTAGLNQAMDELAISRNNVETPHLIRLSRDDSRTTISAENVASLQASLKQDIEGEVRFDKGSRALYATDGSNYRQVPIGVVIPRHVQDVETTVRLARAHSAPVLSRGAGTSLAGQCCNVAVVMDFSKYMHRVLDIDADRRLGRVQPGCVLDHFRETAKQRAGLFFGPQLTAGVRSAECWVITPAAVIRC